jgi:hypothetical protein
MAAETASSKMARLLVPSSASTKRLKTAPKVGAGTASKTARHVVPSAALVKVLETVLKMVRRSVSSSASTKVVEMATKWIDTGHQRWILLDILWREEPSF